MGIWLLKISGEVTTDLAILLRTLGISCTVLFGLAAIVYLIMLLRRIFLADPKAYLSRQRGLKRWLMAINLRLAGTPVNITGQSIHLPLERIYEEMELRRRLWVGRR
ncbi:hypothetical protein [Paenibacillus rhizoplanae]|uniref:hypothetical protein n=1 Tax=Paenibacillus sp. FSL H8-0332 TaxID=2954742 RepID=UPI001AE13915